jgi:hypothetical protein
MRRAAIFSAASRVPATTVNVWSPIVTVQVLGNMGPMLPRNPAPGIGAAP